LATDESHLQENNQAMGQVMITKTDFMIYLEAPMHLWATKHEQLEVMVATPLEQHLMEQGVQIEELARGYLTEEITKKYGETDFFWQQTYRDGPFEARADVMIFDQAAQVYDIYEIKSSTGISKETKYDVTFQQLIFEAKLPVRDFYLVHLNKEYARQGEVDLQELFVVNDMNAEIEALRTEVEKLRTESLRVSLLVSQDGIEGCTKPSTCVCPDLCHPDLPEHPIYDISRIGKKALALKQDGILAIEDIPEDFPLNAKQAQQVQTVKQGKPWIDHKRIQRELEKLEYPLYFLDYETFNPGIPVFDRYHPYEHIVFQYSLHIIERPEGDVMHRECLLSDEKDPGKRLVEQLSQEIGPTGSIIVWYKNFEAGRNKELAERYPEQRVFLLDLNERMYDLMEIFNQGYYVHGDFRGSASLKNVLPVMVPEMDHEDLAISSGQETMITWWKLFRGEIAEEERQKTREEMLKYCKFDTLAMVRILERLGNL